MTTETGSEIERAEKPFQVASQYVSSGDQPAIIAELAEWIEAGEKDVVLLGVTGTSKSVTMAWLIEKVQHPTLIIEPNKTLAAQMAAEFRELTPDNAVEYFVSHYDYYQPEAYVPQTDTFTEKDSSTNDEAERPRHSATNSLPARRDTVVVSLVSCIYGLGTPQEHAVRMAQPEVGQRIDRNESIRRFVDMQYMRNDVVLARGTFRVRGDTVEIIPVYEELATRIEFFGDGIDAIALLYLLTRTVIRRVDRAHVFPASHYVAGSEWTARTLEGVEAELVERLDVLQMQNKVLEAQRLQMRTNHDVEMIRNIGSCVGIKNYSRHIDERGPGTPPNTLLDYSSEDFLFIVDESHVTVPQIGVMYEGDMSRKRALVDRGFCLPSAMDNRLLKFPKFLERVDQMVYLSATPGKYKMEHSDGVVGQIIRFTGFVDPKIVVKPTEGQIDNLPGQIKERVERSERVPVTTPTRKMTEDLTDYLAERDIKVEYLHSDVDILRCVELLRELRLEVFDVPASINLLREDLDLPEVLLVAILDADKQGFLRLMTSLIQIVGRAARNIPGQVIMYADSITPNTREVIDETNRCRAKQTAYNEERGIDPQPLRKKVADITGMLACGDIDTVILLEGGCRKERVVSSEAPVTLRESAVVEGERDLKRLTEEMTELMHEAAVPLKLEFTARYRDEIKGLRSEL